MSVRRRRLDSPFYATFRAGLVTGSGETRGGHVAVDIDDELVGYASAGELEQDVVVARANRAAALEVDLDVVERMKNLQAYAGKADDARRYLAVHASDDGTAADPDEYPWIAIDCEECGCSGYHVASAVLAALRRDQGALTTERARVRLREATRDLIENPDTDPATEDQSP